MRRVIWNGFTIDHYHKKKKKVIYCRYKGDKFITLYCINFPLQLHSLLSCLVQTLWRRPSLVSISLPRRWPLSSMTGQRMKRLCVRYKTEIRGCYVAWPYNLTREKPFNVSEYFYLFFCYRATDKNRTRTAFCNGYCGRRAVPCGQFWLLSGGFFFYFHFHFR